MLFFGVQHLFAGYYRELLDDVNVVKDAFKIAKGFIEKIGS